MYASAPPHDYKLSESMADQDQCQHPQKLTNTMCEKAYDYVLNKPANLSYRYGTEEKGGDYYDVHKCSSQNVEAKLTCKISSFYCMGIDSSSHIINQLIITDQKYCM